MSKLKYCLIIGNPLKKPRSVPIWNNFFKKKKIKLKMFEKDIREKDFKKKYPKSLKTPTFMHQQLQCPTKKKF